MVYLVDDDHEDLEIVQDALAEFSYKGPVMPLTDGRSLLEALKYSKETLESDVIILDLNMPFFNGFQTLQALRSHPSYNTIPVIILTASSNKNDEIKSYEMGCNFFMQKPTRVADYLTLTLAVKKYISDN